MTTIVQATFVAGLLPGLLVAMAQRGPAFRTLPFLACWLLADTVFAALVRFGVR